MNELKLSCIIPVYNGEKFIAGCLKSILDQNFKNLEVIVVDDASTDGTTSIVKKIMKQDARVSLHINSVNQGVSSSRNYGISKATGTHIHFIDSDDNLQKNAYDYIYNFYLEKTSDIIIFDYHQLSIVKFIKSYKTRNLKDNINLAETQQSKAAVLKSGGVVVWNKIFSLEFILKHKLQFINDILYEDIPFFWSTILLANSIYYLNKSLYVYNHRSNSIMNAKLTIHKAKYIVISMMSVKDFLIANNYWQHNEYKNLNIKKLFQAYTSFLSKVKTKKYLLFNKMYHSVLDIDLECIKPYISKWKYYRYSLIKNNKYIIWILLF